MDTRTHTYTRKRTHTTLTQKKKKLIIAVLLLANFVVSIVQCEMGVRVRDVETLRVHFESAFLLPGGPTTPC